MLTIWIIGPTCNRLIEETWWSRTLLNVYCRMMSCLLMISWFKSNRRYLGYIICLLTNQPLKLLYVESHTFHAFLPLLKNYNTYKICISYNVCINLFIKYFNSPFNATSLNKSNVLFTRLTIAILIHYRFSIYILW